MEQMQKQYEYNQQQKFSASSKGGAAAYSEQSQNIKSSNMDNNAQFQQICNNFGQKFANVRKKL